MIKFITGIIVFIGIVIGVLGVVGLADFELDTLTLKEVSFNSKDAQLAGTLIMPPNVENPPIALIIHGDGPQNRFSGGGYLPLIHAFIDAGIGVFTWDKAGIGQSTGNWLDQSMQDRSDEALAARQAIADVSNIEMDNIGFLGFSQAGWVLPRVANEIAPAFTIIVGGAVSWRNQGTYYDKIKMQLEGAPEDQITLRLNDRLNENDKIFASPTNPSTAPDMPTDRFNFVANAYWEDVTDLIGGMKGPVLGIWGRDDLNVDPIVNSSIYQEHLAPLSDTRKVVIIADAAHGLQRSIWFNYQSSNEWPWYLEYLYLGMGRNFYSDGSLSEITGWIKRVTNN